MKVKIELVKNYISSRICDYVDDIIEFDANEIINTKAIEILQAIQNVIQSDMDDFEMIEEIVCIFERNNLNAGVCHDFG